MNIWKRITSLPTKYYFSEIVSISIIRFSLVHVQSALHIPFPLPFSAFCLACKVNVGSCHILLFYELAKKINQVKNRRGKQQKKGQARPMLTITCHKSGGFLSSQVEDTSGAKYRHDTETFMTTNFFSAKPGRNAYFMLMPSAGWRGARILGGKEWVRAGKVADGEILRYRGVMRWDWETAAKFLVPRMSGYIGQKYIKIK